MGESLLKPQWQTNHTIQDISIKDLKQLKINTLLIDVDGTLLPRNQSVLSNSVIEWIKYAKKHLFIHLLSNNPYKKRIESIANDLNLTFTHSASKPRRAKTLKVLNAFKIKSSSVGIIGDRIF